MIRPTLMIPVGRLPACRCTEPSRCWHWPLPPFEADAEVWRHFTRTVVWRIDEARRTG